MKKFFAIFVLSILVSISSVSTAFAAKTHGTSPTIPLGNDISYPQCGKSSPSGQAFGVVGVNGGLATTTNSCLKDQLVWANKSTGLTNQPKIQLYVNTANPGGLGTASWPSYNVDPSGIVSQNPAICDGADSIACAWQYGWNRAVEANLYRFGPAAKQANLNADAANYTWWLDVETMNTWKPSTSSFNYQSNTAVLEGMRSYFASVSAKVGLYSTAYQWGKIVGPAVTPTSNLNGLDNWRPSGSSLNNAKSNCSVASLTPGGKITITQFISKQLDYDYSCI